MRSLALVIAAALVLGAGTTGCGSAPEAPSTLASKSTKKSTKGSTSTADDDLTTGDDDMDGDGELTPTTPAQTNPGGTSSSGSAPPPAAPADTVWVGKITKTATVDFGGAPYCKYNVHYTEVTVRLTLDAGNQVKQSLVTAKMNEATTADCDNEPLGVLPHKWSFVPVGDPSASLTINHDIAATNELKASLVLTGTMDGTESIKAKLKFHRIDIGAPFNWTVNADIALTKM